MAKENDQIKTMGQIIRKMEEHNLVEVKIGDIHLKKEKPQDIADTVKQRELDKKEKVEAKRIAEIRLNCPYPCPHWQSEQPTPEQEVG